jgi:hypothetical protein
MKIHPHHDLIIAYLEDKVIQYKSLTEWVDIPTLTAFGGALPPFNHNTEYRLKPVVKPNVFFRLRAKIVGRDVVVRSPEHWEPENLSLEFDGNTNKLVAAIIID